MCLEVQSSLLHRAMMEKTGSFEATARAPVAEAKFPSIPALGNRDSFGLPRGREVDGGGRGVSVCGRAEPCVTLC